jgi:acetyltransferase-like isoleucine patch superfamily enzyme
MKFAFAFAIAILPFAVKRLILIHIFKYEIHPESYIGISVLVGIDKLVLGKGARIGHFTVIKNLAVLHVGDFGRVGNLNWISGVPLGHSGAFAEELGREPILEVGEHAAITHRHLIDCTAAVRIGRFGTVAGYRSQLLTHSVNIGMSRQKSAPLTIGAYSFVGTGSILLPGSVVPDYSVIGAGSVVTCPLEETYALYAGAPARRIKSLNQTSAYFVRMTGTID